MTLKEVKVLLQPKVIDFDKMRKEYNGFAIGDKIKTKEGTKGIIDNFTKTQPDNYGNVEKYAIIKSENGKIFARHLSYVEHIQ